MDNSFSYEKHQIVGTHLLIEFWDCSVPDDKKKLKEILTQAAIESKSEPLGSSIHTFEPQGITGVLVLSESHISVHSWPEYGYAALDIFTCGAETLPYAALEYLKKQFKPGKVEVQEIKRGNLENANVGKKIQTNIRA